MRIKLYAFLCVLGALLPLWSFVPWVLVHGLDFFLLIQAAFNTPISAFAWIDVLASAATLILFIFWESKRIGLPRPWIALCGLAIGVSLALPLFLLLREKHLIQLSNKG